MKSRLSVFLVALLCMLCGGCAGGGLVLRAKVQDPAAAKLRKVAVVPDRTMANEEAAGQLAALTKEKLREAGFAPVGRAQDAELIVVAFAAKDGSSSSAGPTTLRDSAPPSLSYGQVHQGMISDTFSRMDRPVGTAAERSFVLTVQAYPRSVWMSDAEEVAPVWSVVAKGTPPPENQGSFVARMLTASAPFFAQDTGTKPLRITLP